MIGRDWLNSDSVAHAYLPSAPESGDSAVRVLFRFLPGSDHGRAPPVIGGWALVSGSRPGPGRRACKSLVVPWPAGQERSRQLLTIRATNPDRNPPSTAAALITTALPG
jgi:hypothetical protein